MTKTKIFNKQSRPPHGHSEVGFPVRDVYKLRTDEFGVEGLVKVDETNFYDYIQSHRDSVDLNVLMARYELGDSDALNKVQGFYGDASDLPSDLLGYYRLNERGEQMFSELPADVKQLFNGSYTQFLADTDPVSKIQGLYAQKNAAVAKSRTAVDEEVSTDE